MFSPGLHPVLRGTLIDTTRACPKESNPECVRPQAKLHEEQLKEMKIFGVKKEKKRKMKKNSNSL